MGCTCAILLGLSFIGWTKAGSEPLELEFAEIQLYLSYAAYCGTNVNSDWNCYWCGNVPGVELVGLFGDSGGSGFGYVAKTSDGSIHVVYRGTDNLVGWIADADFKQTPYYSVAGAAVHQGFFEITQNITAEILTLLQQAYTTNSVDIVVSGHSLGAALSTLGALEIQTYFEKSHETFANITLYNFGSPRVGNQAFAAYAQQQIPNTIWRMTNERDPVPHLPPESFFGLSYYHVANEVWRSGGTTYIQCDTGESQSCADSITITNPLDHATYMGIDVLAGLPHGCLYTDP